MFGTPCALSGKFCCPEMWNLTKICGVCQNILCLSQSPQINSKRNLSCILSLSLCICVIIFVIVLISNTILWRVGFGIWLSNSTEKFKNPLFALKLFICSYWLKFAHKLCFRVKIYSNLVGGGGFETVPLHDDDEIVGAKGNDPISVCNRLGLHSIPHQCPLFR